MGVLGRVGLGKPQQGYGGMALGKDIFGENVQGAAHLCGGGFAAVGPRAEAGDYFGVQRAGQAEVRVDGCAAARLGVGVLQVGVAGCSGAYGDVFAAMAVQDVAEGGFQQHGMVCGNFRERRFQGADGAVRVKLRDDQHIPGQAVSAGVVAGDDAGDVGPGDGGEDGMMIDAGNALSGEAG